MSPRYIIIKEPRRNKAPQDANNPGSQTLPAMQMQSAGTADMAPLGPEPQETAASEALTDISNP